jgi:adenylyl- and sulfurtransferase ThiI
MENELEKNLTKLIKSLDQATKQFIEFNAELKILQRKIKETFGVDNLEDAEEIRQEMEDEIKLEKEEIETELREVNEIFNKFERTPT